MTDNDKRGSILELLRSAADAALDKKAESIQLLDLEGFGGITDFFLICHGNSQRQVDAIVESINTRLREVGSRPNHVEGDRNADWVLMDYLDFVVHVFTRDRREFYGLEKLWADAPRLELETADTADTAPPG